MRVEFAEMFTGGGTLLAALLEGFRRTGAEVAVAGLIEIDPKYLAVCARAHPEASTWNASATAWHPAELSAPRNGLRAFVAGIPCAGASRAGLAKNGISCAEEHPDVGHLFLPALHYVRQHRPELVIFENTDTYRNTLSARLIRDSLTMSGYSIDEHVIDSYGEFETPTQRKRWVMVASRIGRFTWFYEAKPFRGTLAPYLDAEGPADEAESATPEQVTADEAYIARKTAEGCGFLRGRKILERADRRVGTIPRTYGRRHAAGTFVRTARSYRMLRPREIARLHGFREDLFEGLPKTTQYELLGQGVVANPFRVLGEALARFAAGERVIPAGQLELPSG